MLSVLLILFQLLPPLLHQIPDGKQYYHFDLKDSDTEFRRLGNCLGPIVTEGWSRARIRTLVT